MIWNKTIPGPGGERWFWPGAFRRALGRTFEDARVDYLLSPDEAASALFRRVPSARLMTLWTARPAESATVMVSNVPWAVVIQPSTPSTWIQPRPCPTVSTPTP